VNGKVEASTLAHRDLQTQLMCSHLPLLLHDEPEDVLVIGLASGITAGSASTHPVSSLRIVEVEREMIPAARLFEKHNHRVLDDPRVEVSINDARNDLEFSSRTYDVIISEPSNPWMTVAANLFTEDFFRLARTRLRESGIFSQWIQTYYLPPEDLRSIVAAFRESFPHVMLFETYGGVDVILLGSRHPFGLDLERIGSRMSELKVLMDLARINARRPVDVLSLFALGPAEIDRLVVGAPRNTDDNARVEFAAPKTLGVATGEDNIAMLRALRPDPFAYVEPEITDREERDGLLLDLAEIWRRRGERALARKAAGRAVDGPLGERAETLLKKLEGDDSL
jgi:spermidine synthase